MCASLTNLTNQGVVFPANRQAVHVDSADSPGQTVSLARCRHLIPDKGIVVQATGHNATKCTHMTYGNPKIRSQYKMKEGDGRLTDIRHDDEAEKDLGVLFDRKLSFRQHIGSIVKVNRMIGLTRRTFHYMVEEVFRLLYTSLMRPHMDYADCIWSPHLKVDIAQLENAQRRVTREMRQVLREPTESLDLAQPFVQEKTHGYDSNIPYHR